MKTRIQLAGFFYVIFSILTAHSALVSTEAMDSQRSGHRVYIDQADKVVPDYKRLDRFDKNGIGPYKPNNLPEPSEPVGKAAYTVIVWGAEWCRPCKTYKAKEVPALQKIGYRVVLKDYDSDDPPDEVRYVPTVMLYYKGELLRTKTYWKATDINKYVDNRMSLKG